jgi:ATP-dependent DNA helicase RecQ
MERAVQILNNYFGYKSFRRGQEEIISALLKGRDCLAVMPTGAGKSLCYQIPALVLEGVSLVISPLISLMRDQVTALKEAGISAAFINSSLTAAQTRLVLQRAEQGLYKIIYVAPERLDTQGFVEWAQNADISMVAVDEAHCVSHWGQDFRPSYLNICGFIKGLARRPVVSAFTATATETVKQDVARILELNEPLAITTGFNRENLYFEVQHPERKEEALKQYLSRNSGRSGIIYCISRRLVEEVCETLCNEGYAATRYHAGLGQGERSKNQEDFLFDRKTVMVATNAFGMGIDKSNVGFVIHYNMPKNLESYYQEAGRAGRDGTPADCILLYSGTDVRTNLWMIENSEENESLSEEEQAQLKHRERERLRRMCSYCSTTNCLRSFILAYFGENEPVHCENCSNCNEGGEIQDVTVDAQKLLSCVARTQERYGIKLVTDVLRGSKTARLKELGFDSLSTFGIMSERTVEEIRRLADFLVQGGYLEITSTDEFPIATLTPLSRKVLQGAVRLEMRQLPLREGKGKKRAERSPVRKAKGERVAVNDSLFTQLKALRLKIAVENTVPPFVIFSDASLIDMCARLPQTDEDFLAVSGVGKFKLAQFGERFLDVIRAFKPEEAEGASQQSGSVMGTDELIEYIEQNCEFSSEPIPISQLMDKINAVLMQKIGGRVIMTRVTNLLLEDGYLEKDLASRIATEKGREAGISSVERKSERSGDMYMQNLYNQDAQRLVLSCVKRLLEREE